MAEELERIDLPSARARIVKDILTERGRQAALHPGDSIADQDPRPRPSALSILIEEVGEVGKAINEAQGRSALRAELLQVETVVFAWIEQLDNEAPPMGDMCPACDGDGDNYDGKDPDGSDRYRPCDPCGGTGVITPPEPVKAAERHDSGPSVPTCVTCGGYGEVAGNKAETIPPKPCPSCGGTGKQRLKQRAVLCPTCAGLSAGQITCPTCLGEGKVLA